MLILWPRQRIGTPRLRWSEAAQHNEWNDTSIIRPRRRGWARRRDAVAGAGGCGMDGGHPDGVGPSHLVVNPSRKALLNQM
jgi:hypothetical protein